MSGTESVRKRLEREFRGFMDRDVADLREEELDMAMRTLRALQADAAEEEDKDLMRVVVRCKEGLRRHRQRRVNERAVRDRRDGRRY